jgi:N-methylhydantoinase B
MPAHATTLAQEGHIVSPVVAVEHDRWADEFYLPFLEATRTPEERRGDLAAQIGANTVGAQRLAELATTEGVARFREVGNELLGYGERRMSVALAALPDGIYRFEDFMEWGDQDVTIRVAVTVSGDGLLADFSGTDPQVEANFNAVEAVTRSCLYYAVRVATDPSIPANGGCYRMLELRTERGSLVDASPPAAVAAGNVETSQRISDVILGALAEAAPKRVGAAGQGTMNNVLIGNESFAYYETVAGGQGGRPTGPGQSGIQTGMTNTENTPIEALSTHYPFEVTRYTLRRGSGGRGQHPGGEGIEREIEFGEPATLSLMGERRRNRPWGLCGGEPGATGEDWLIKKSGDRIHLPGKTTLQVERGDRLLVLTPGGGGWGNPQT